MNCPDAETLIAFAMNPLATENGDLAAHIHGCAECRLNLKLVNETLLAADWSSPSKPVDVGAVIRPETSSSPLSPVAGDSIDKYIRVLDKDVKDPDGAWMWKGTKVLFDPDFPERLERATPDNIQGFIENGYSFFKKLSPQTVEALKAARGEINQFGPAMDRNIASLAGKTMPNMKLPTWVNFLPWPIRLSFRNQVELSVEKDSFAKWLSSKGLLPPRESLSPNGWADVCNANFFRVYESRALSVSFRFFVVYITPIDPHTFTLSPVDVNVYSKVKEFIHDWSSNAAGGVSRAPDAVNGKCYILGTSSGWGEVRPALLQDGVDLLCSPSRDVKDAWCVRHHDLSPFRPVFRNFVQSLYPETAESRVSRVRTLIDGGSLDGSLTASKLSRLTLIPEEVVERIFDVLQGDGRNGYENYLTEKGESAIRKVSRDVKPTMFFRKSGNALWQYAKALLVVLSFVGEYARQFVASGSVKMGLAAICVSVLAITYVQSCFEGFFRRRLEK